MKVEVRVTLRESVLDPQGKAIMKGLQALGFDEVLEVRQGKYFEITLEDKPETEVQARVEQMCKKLLANPVIEDFFVTERENDV